MQPSSSEHARFLHAMLAAVLVGGAVGVGGCGSAPAGGQSSPFLPADTVAPAQTDRDSALAVLTSMRRAVFDSAFARMAGYVVTRRVRTEQLTPAGSTTAAREYAVRFVPDSVEGTVLRRDSTGAFQSGGTLGSLSSSRPVTARPPNPAPEALADPPPYLAPRTREAFRYAVRADTLLDGTPVTTVVTQARPNDPGRDQGVRFARLRLTREDHVLVGATVVRARRTLLFREDSRLTVRLRRAPDGADGGWVPAATRFHAIVDVPFRASRQFRTVATYTDYARPARTAAGRRPIGAGTTR